MPETTFDPPVRYYGKLKHDIRRVSTGEIVWMAGDAVLCEQAVDPSGDLAIIATRDGTEYCWLDLQAVERLP